MCQRDAAGNVSAVTSAGMFITNAASNIAAFIDDAEILGQREAMAAYHLTPRADGENTFTGFTDLTGFTTVTVTDASALMSALSGLTLGQKRIVECAWEGPSSTAKVSTGHVSTSLTANAAVDWGYNRPDTSVLIRPAPGYKPVLQSTALANELRITGYNRLEIRGMEFDNPRIRMMRTSTYPGLCMVALKGNTFRNCLNGAFLADIARVIHSEGNTFINCLYGTIGAAEFFRVWNNKYDDHRENDLASTRGYDTGISTNWKANIWYFGNRCCKNSQIVFTSGLHPDGFQINASTDTHQGHRLLIEFNVLDQNNHPNAYGTQTFFGNNYTLTNSNDWLVHNNVVAASAYWVCLMADPADNGTKIAYRNMFVRAGYANAAADAWQAITGGRNAVGAGSMLIKENYFTDEPSQWDKVANYSRVGNISVDPRKGAPIGTRMAIARRSRLVTRKPSPLAVLSRNHQPHGSCCTVGVAAGSARIAALAALNPSDHAACCFNSFRNECALSLQSAGKFTFSASLRRIISSAIALLLFQRGFHFVSDEGADGDINFLSNEISAPLTCGFVSSISAKLRRPLKSPRLGCEDFALQGFDSLNGLRAGCGDVFVL